jgi:hypothetical protein
MLLLERGGEAEALGSMTIHTGKPATKAHVKMSLGQCAKAMELFEQAMQGGATRLGDPHYRRDAIGRVIVEDGLARMDESVDRPHEDMCGAWWAEVQRLVRAEGAVTRVLEFVCGFV